MIIWDTSKPIYYWPKKIKLVYIRVYKDNFKKFNFWVDKISNKNQNNINWWLNKAASRDERISNLYKNICIFLTILTIKKTKLKLEVQCESGALIKLIKKQNIKNCIIKLKKREFFLKNAYLIISEVLLLFLNISLIKIFLNNPIKKNNKRIDLIDQFEISSKKKRTNYFGKFLSDKKKNFFIVPTFLSYRPSNILFYNKKIILKESLLKYRDLFFIISNVIFNKIKLNTKYLSYNFDSLINEDLKLNNNFRSELISYTNFIFFKNLKKNNYRLGEIYSWNENQIIDKGWCLGVNTFYPDSKFIGYQGATLHPQFFNLSTTNSEFYSGVLPKNIFLVGKKYLKNRKLFSNKIDYKITNKNRFNLSKENSKKKIILFLLSGIKSIDLIMIEIFKTIYDQKFSNLKIKFHPIMPSKNFPEKVENEIKGNAASLIKSSKIVITSSYTSGLYESLANDIYTIMVDFTPFDKNLYSDLRLYSKKIFFNENALQVFNSIKKINSFKNISYQNKVKIKKLFFNK